MTIATKLAAERDARILELEAEVKAMREDARRYRWLRSQDTVPYPSDFHQGQLQNLIVFWDGPEQLDSAIDAALANKESSHD